MSDKNRQWYKKKLLIISLAITFFYTLHLALPIYILSDYLSVYMNAKYISVVFALSGLLSIYLINSYNKFLLQYHNYKTTIGLIVADILAIVMMSIVNSPVCVGIFTMLYISIVALLGVSVNLYVQEFSDHEDTGVIRGIFLTVSSLALILGLFITNKLTLPVWDLETYVFKHNDYTLVFWTDALLLLPIVYLVSHYYNHVPEPRYRGGHMWSVLKHLRRNVNLKGVFTANLMVAIFVTTMIIYFVNYLTMYGHLSIADYIGILMPIALLPFVFLPYKVGELADKKYGEKEFMIIGLIIMAISLLAIPLATMYIEHIIATISVTLNNASTAYTGYGSTINSASTSNISISNISLPVGIQYNIDAINTGLHYKLMIIWGSILFLGRIGSSMVETAANSYFYKTVSRTDSDSVALFTNVGAIGALIGSAVAILSFYLDNIINNFIKNNSLNYNLVISQSEHSSLYIIVALLIIYNLRHVKKIQDTK